MAIKESGPSRAQQNTRSNTFRHQYRELSQHESGRVERIKDLAELLEKEFLGYDTDTRPYTVPDRCRALALTKLEEAVMWAVKGITL